VTRLPSENKKKPAAQELTLSGEGQSTEAGSPFKLHLKSFRCFPLFVPDRSYSGQKNKMPLARQEEKKS
jgi:hypothetical protein